MEVALAVSSVKGKREEYLSVSRESPESRDIKLELKKGKNPVISSKFEFTKGEWGPEAARLWILLQVSVIAQYPSGIADKVFGKSSLPVTAAELEIEFVSLLKGTKLEIESLRLVWDSSPLGKTLPKKDVERLYSLAVQSKLPENLTKDVDSQALLLFELLRGSKVSIG